MGSRCLIRLSALLYSLCAVTARSAESAGIDFFEKKIRPVLAEQCYKCHSATSEKIKGKLRVDSRAALLKGGESGPGLVPGTPEKSLLIEAIVYTNQDLQMPPKTKLSDAVIQDFTAWVKDGAPWPEDKDSKVVVEEKKIDYDKLRKEHWAFQPLKHIDPPAVKDEAWPAGALDRFVLAKLDEKQIKPSPRADRYALLRRVTFDLTGLPPTPEEIDAFIKDKSPGAFEKVVDRLLASPHFGERFGRHWLDVARYAESAGGGRIVPYPNAWKYRDYVIKAFNSDKPYNEFLAQQIAGDLLPTEDLEKRRENIIATGFLSVASKNLDTQDKDLLRMDVVDEQLDTIGKAFLGMTIGCARCHDHKFDPIPTKEYYALAGIFRSTKTLTPGNVSGVVQTVLPADPATNEKIAEYEKHIAALEDRLHRLRTGDGTVKQVDPGKTVAAPASGKKYTSKVDAASLPGIVVDNAEANIIGTWIKSVSTKVFVGENYLHDNGKAKGEMSISFSPSLPKGGIYEVRMSYSSANTRPERVPVIVQHAEGETTIYVNEREAPPIEGLMVSLGKFRFQQGNDGSVTISNQGTTGVVTADAVQFLPLDENAAPPAADPQAQKGADVAVKTPAAKKADEEVEVLKKLEAEIKEAKKGAPAGPAALAVRDEEQVSDYNVCVRGDVHRLGEPTPRGYLSLVSFDAKPVNAAQSGRAELAKWMIDPKNPLTPRVMVNRLWHHLFGAGIVRSNDNFGTTGDKPTHPELLDYLAEKFVASGWSVKKIVREIVLSRTYQEAVAESAAGAKADPQNRLLWRSNRRRLQVEAIRDAILANSGILELNGSPGEIAGAPEIADGAGAKPALPGATTTPAKVERKNPPVRTVYLPLRREAIDEMLEIFDFADTNLVVGNRNTSNLPTQSLFLMNSPFAIEQARKAAERLTSATGLDDAARIQLAYLRALGRPPSATELSLSQKFLAQAGSGDAARVWGQFYQALIGCVNFRYLD